MEVAPSNSIIGSNFHLTLPSDIRKSVLRYRPVTALTSHFRQTMATMGPDTLTFNSSKKIGFFDCVG
ncbi:hypothetical protein OROMI_016917 [Orobanche minor]